MKFSSAVSYALAAVVQIAANGGSRPLANRIICETAKMPERFVLQILRHLVNAGVLTSVRGVDGGYKLARPANRISLLDIYESIDHFDGGKDVWCQGLVPSSQQILRETFDGIVTDARKRLSGVTIADLRAKA
ncbi:RrF2 family transcriptional regulator [Lacipirellula sp.]|uniref:RrF2 family transcriptional regulator n=1 Tax=Lacipirellula sp. TaxID=2691419 RepID=UPI003D0E06ED